MSGCDLLCCKQFSSAESCHTVPYISMITSGEQPTGSTLTQPHNWGETHPLAEPICPFKQQLKSYSKPR